MGLGAAKAIDPSEAEANGSYDVILENVGAINFESNLRSLNMWGRMLIIGRGRGYGGQARLHAALLQARNRSR